MNMNVTMNMKGTAHRFLLLGAGHRAREHGSLPQEHLEGRRLRVLHRKTSPRRLQARRQREREGLGKKPSQIHVIIDVGPLSWRQLKYLNETGGRGDLSVEVFLSLFLLHLQGES